jgi:hypothetical protein
VRVDVGFGRREQILSEHRLLYRRDSDATDAKTSTRVLAVPTMASHRKSPAATSGCGVRFGLLQTQHCLLSSGQCSSSRYTNVSSSCPFSLHFLLFLFPSADIPPNTTRTDFPFVRVFFMGTAATGFSNLELKDCFSCATATDCSLTPFLDEPTHPPMINGAYVTVLLRGLSSLCV